MQKNKVTHHLKKYVIFFLAFQLIIVLLCGSLAIQAAASNNLTQRQALDKVIQFLYPNGGYTTYWLGRGEFASYRLKASNKDFYLDSNGNQGGYYLIHQYSIIVDNSKKNLSHVSTSNWFEVYINNGKIIPMYLSNKTLNKEYGKNNSKKAKNVDYADNTYHNDKFRFTLTFPKSWKVKYVTEEYQTKADGVVIATFYHKASYDASGPDFKMGRLFSVCVYTSQGWNKDKNDITSMTEDFGVVKNNNLVFYFAGPTDVQFDNNNKKAAAEYQAMSKDIRNIVKTMSFDKAAAGTKVDMKTSSQKPSVVNTKPAAVQNEFEKRLVGTWTAKVSSMSSVEVK